MGVHERATDLVARWLARFRLGLDADDSDAYTENEKLQAGIIVGGLAANGFIDFGDEKWVTIESAFPLASSGKGDGPNMSVAPTII